MRKKKRRSKQISLRLKPQDGCAATNGEECDLVASVRVRFVALAINSGNWPHLNMRQARRLRDFLTRAIREIAARGRHATKDRVTKAAGLDAARAVLGQTSLDTTNSYGSQLDLETAARIAAQLG